MLMIDNFPQEFMETAVNLREYGMDGFAWRLEETLKVLRYLKSRPEITVLGGDAYLYIPKKDVLYPLLENWYFIPDGKNDHIGSVEKAIEYVERTKDKPIADDVVIDLVISSSATR